MLDEWKAHKVKLKSGEAGSKEDNAKSGLENAEFQQMQFGLNNLKTEVDYLKKVFSVTKMQEIDQHEDKLRKLGYEMELL